MANEILDLKVKKLGFGGMRFPLLDENKVEKVDLDQVIQMVDHFMQKGFTYFDTAYPYHNGYSEAAFRKALVERYERSNFLLADKMPTFFIKSNEDYARFFKTQLRRCGVKYFDFYLLHNLGKKSYQTAVETGGFEFLQQVKLEGKARFVGFSFHDDAALLEQILSEHPEIDFVQLQINYLDWESNTIQSRACYEVALEHKKPVIVMEPVKGGMLANLPEQVHNLFTAYNPEVSGPSWAVRFAASLENVFVVLSGMSNLAQMEDNTSYMENFVPVNAEEKAILDQAVAAINDSVAIPCTNCKYCLEECPQEINIPVLFSIYNSYKINRQASFPEMHYERQIYGRGKASDCIECRQCEDHCPQHIEITGWLKEIAATFEKTM